MGFLRREDLDDMDSGELRELASKLSIPVGKEDKRSAIARKLLKEAPDLNPLLTRDEAIGILADGEYWDQEKASEFIDRIIENTKDGII